MGSYRKLAPAEVGQLIRHLSALAPDERRMRFQGAVSLIAIERHCRRIDWFRTVVIGFFVDGRLRGAAELVLDRALVPRDAEIAVTVEAPWQGSGVGTELVRRSRNCEYLIVRNNHQRRNGAAVGFANLDHFAE